jgi:hypothetical protein
MFKVSFPFALQNGPCAKVSVVGPRHIDAMVPHGLAYLHLNRFALRSVHLLIGAAQGRRHKPQLHGHVFREFGPQAMPYAIGIAPGDADFFHVVAVL